MSQYQDDNEWEDWAPARASSSVMPRLAEDGEEIVSLSHSELEKIPWMKSLPKRSSWAASSAEEG